MQCRFNDTSGYLWMLSPHISACLLIYSHLHAKVLPNKLLSCLQVHHNLSLSLSFVLFFYVSHPDRLAAALSGTVLVIEDMLTSVDRY